MTAAAKLLHFAAAIAGAATLIGCASQAPAPELVGRYSSSEAPWYLMLDREGNIEFSFCDPQPGVPPLISRGYCDFSADPLEPEVFPQLDRMRGKFKLIWEPDGSRVTVQLTMSDNNDLVMRHGHKMMLFREKTPQKH